MHTFQEVLESYGTDYANTMERVMNDKKLYLKLLAMLMEDDSLERLGSALETENLSEAFDAAHTLKGIAANMGLIPLLNSVCAIVEPLRIEEKRGDYLELYREIEAEFKEVEKMQQQLEEAAL